MVVLELDEMFFTRKICWNFVVYKPVLEEKNRENISSEFIQQGSVFCKHIVIKNVFTEEIKDFNLHGIGLEHLLHLKIL